MPFGHAGMTRVKNNVIKRDLPSGLAVCRAGRRVEKLMCDERESGRPATEPQDESRGGINLLSMDGCCLLTTQKYNSVERLTIRTGKKL